MNLGAAVDAPRLPWVCSGFEQIEMVKISKGPQNSTGRDSEEQHVDSVYVLDETLKMMKTIHWLFEKSITNSHNCDFDINTRVYSSLTAFEKAGDHSTESIPKWVSASTRYVIRRGIPRYFCHNISGPAVSALFFGVLLSTRLRTPGQLY